MTTIPTIAEQDVRNLVGEGSFQQRDSVSAIRERHRSLRALQNVLAAAGL